MTVAILIDGTAGNDTLTGTDGGDLILGYGGNDRLVGLAGDDTLDGGAGANQIDAGDGDDLILVDGSATNASVYVPGTGIDGGAGVDTIQFAAASTNFHIVKIVGGPLQVTDLTTGARTIAINVEHLQFTDTDIWLVPHVNTPAVITGDVAGAVSEDGILTATGQLAVTDVDPGEAAFIPETGLIGSYGSLKIDATGAWTYALDNANPAVQALAAGALITDVVQVHSLDGTTAAITIAVAGADEINLILGTASADRLTGTAANDHILGLAGSDRINGKSGDDVLTGGDGADRFIFAGPSGHDTISDFEVTRRGEAVDLSSLDGARGFRDLVAHHLVAVDGAAVITFGSVSITLQGVAVADLTANDFLF